MISALILGIAFAGILILWNYCLWEGNILDKFGAAIFRKPTRFIDRLMGACLPCMCFWWGLLFLMRDYHHYTVFLGASELFIIFYTAMIKGFQGKI